MSKRRFSGGDSLTGFQKYLHKVLVLNELAGRLDIAYQLSYAGTGKSGYSFSANQLDLSNNAVARVLFREILMKNKFNKQEIDAYIKQFEENRKFTDIKNNKDVKKINKALSSDEGVKLIDEAYKKSIKEHVQYVDRVIKVAHKDLQPYIKDPVVKLIIADVHNQYGTKNNRKIREFLKGEEVIFTKKVKLDLAAIKSSDDLIVQIRMAIHAIANGPKSEADITRRQDNIDKIAALVPQNERVAHKVVSTGSSPEKRQSEESPLDDNHATKKDGKPQHERHHQSGGDHPSHHHGDDSPRVHALKKQVKNKHDEQLNRAHTDNNCESPRPSM